MLKIKTGENHTFLWRAPKPVLSGTTPTLVVKRAGAAIAGIPALSKIVEDQTVVSISTDRRRVTSNGELVFADAAYSQDMKNGYAFFISPNDEHIPVKVQSIDISDSGNVIGLADPLPREVDAAGSIQWVTWYTTFTSDDVTEEASRQIGWEVEYLTPSPGAAGNDPNTQNDFGRLYVVDRIFKVALTTLELYDYVNELSSGTPRRANSREGDIEFAHLQLVQDVRNWLCAKGDYSEDDADADHFKVPLIYLSASLILDSVAPDKAAIYYERYTRSLEKALECVWIDLDKDGEIDEGDSNLSSPIRLSSFYKKYGPAIGRPTYSWNKPH